MQITSFSNPQIKALTALHMRKSRRESGLFLTEGRRHIEAAVKNNWIVDTLVYLKSADISGVNARNMLEVTPEIMAKITRKDNPQNILAAVKARTNTLSAVTHEGTWIALEGIRDPGNLGTIMRTADSVGARGVILIDDCCDPFSTEAMRASMGALFACPIVLTSRDAFIAHINQWQGTVVGTALNPRAVDFREITYKSPTILVMGTEQSGLTDPLMHALPHLAKLPMRDGTDSLNLAIATGVMLYAALHPWEK